MRKIHSVRHFCQIVLQGWGGYAQCVIPQQTQTQTASSNPAHPTGKLHTQLHRPSCLLLLLQTASHLLCLLYRHFWEVTMSFYHLSGFIAGLTDFRVILLPPALKLSALSQRVRKEATSPTMEVGGLVEVLWLHWPQEDGVACGATTHKTWAPGMP